MQTCSSLCKRLAGLTLVASLAVLALLPLAAEGRAALVIGNGDQTRGQTPACR